MRDMADVERRHERGDILALVNMLMLMRPYRFLVR